MDGVFVSGFAVVSIPAVKLFSCTGVGVAVPAVVSAACVVGISPIDVTSRGVPVVINVEPAGSSEGTPEISHGNLVTSDVMSVSPEGVCVVSGTVPSIGVVPCSTVESVLPSVGPMVAAVSGSSIGISVVISGDSSAFVFPSAAGTTVTSDAGGKGTARFPRLCLIGAPTKGPRAAKLLPCWSGIAAASA